MSLWTQIIADRDAVLMQSRDGLTVTAIQLSTGQQFTGFFFETDSERDGKFGIANCIKGALWVPTTVVAALQEQWSITREDASVVEVTVMSYGARSAGMIELRVEQIDVMRFERTGLALGGGGYAGNQ